MLQGTNGLKGLLILTAFCILYSCKKGSSPSTPVTPVVPASFSFNSLKVNGVTINTSVVNGLNTSPVIKISFTAPVKTSSVAGSVSLTGGTTTPTFTTAYLNNDSTIVITPNGLSHLTAYTLSISTNLKDAKNGGLQTPFNISLRTAIDSTNKFTTITDDALLTLVQQQTFNYFWSGANTTSGLAYERITAGAPSQPVTIGGSGFGIMGIVVGVNRAFITRAQGLQRMQTIVAFLKNAQTFHGAFPHWMDGTTGKVIPFSSQDDGADLVETAYLMEGLLTARQYFNGTNTAETQLRTDINTLWNNVEWTWFQNNQNTLFWHWSPDFGWESNQQIQGWNEALITYVLAASSTTHAITKAVYDDGWANKGGMKNGNSYYGVALPLGPPDGGPLFFTHYSFLGINPNGLSDAYASYDVQNKAHAMINYNYCVANPNNFYGYSSNCWGLTASDVENNGYNANSPTSDLGVIAPTAAISSLPYTPTQSLQALHFFYYKLGDKLWGQYGFYDSFNLNDAWFDNANLAIDEGPIIGMIENYRTGLLWNLFMSCPEVKTGMTNLGFKGPNL